MSFNLPLNKGEIMLCLASVRLEVAFFLSLPFSAKACPSRFFCLTCLHACMLACLQLASCVLSSLFCLCACT